MENVDLNLENYSLEDILQLFHINYNFTKDELLKCKKMVLKTHPDKSKLDSKYFLFFSKAYNIVFKIYEFKNKQQMKPYQEEFYSEEKKELLNK